MIYVKKKEVKVSMSKFTKQELNESLVKNVIPTNIIMSKHQLQILVHVVFFILSHILPTFKETRVIVDVGTSRKFQFDIRNAKS